MDKNFIMSVISFVFSVIFIFCLFISLYQNTDIDGLNKRVDIANSENIVQNDIFDIVLEDYNDSGKILRFKHNDTLFLFYKSGYGVGLTQMYDVNGMPLTYESYLQN